MKNKQHKNDSKKNSKPGQAPEKQAKQQAPEKQAKQQAPETTANASGALGTLLGFSVISVVRAMGKAGWDFDRASKALKHNKIQAAERTIRGALRRGRKGQMSIAPVDEKALAALC